MYQDIKKNWGKAKLLILFVTTITLLLLLTVVYKSDQKITKKSELIKNVNEESDLKKFKKFLLNQIKSPFINLDYEINNSIIKFSVPNTKSTTIEITKNEENQIISKKIITKLYKKKILSENIIKNNLYSSAIEARVNPDTIIEFARIFGFEIDFQRDIRKMIILKLFMKNILMKMVSL